MTLGMMNNPTEDLFKEIKWIGENGFDFIDLSLEPPRAYAGTINLEEVKKLLTRYGMEVVGHTAYYLPLASPYQSLREKSVEEFILCLEVFHKLGVKLVSIHPDSSHSCLSREEILELNLLSLEKVSRVGEKLGIKLVVENMTGIFNRVEDYERLFSRLPRVGFHLDVGHANLGVEKNRSEEFILRLGPWLKHVHLSDNRGGEEDLHLPLGCGSIDWEKIIKALKRAGYNGTITLEVFSRDHDYRLLSRDKFRELWRRV